MNYVIDDDIFTYDLQGTGTGTHRPTTIAKFNSALMINYVGKNVECDVCSEWRLANNNKTLVFTLIPGVKFHSGQELTSEDVKYSLRMIMGDVDGIVSQRSGSLKEFVTSIETPSRYEVRVNISYAPEYVLKILAVTNSVIYPAGTIRDTLVKAPAGSGPYLLTKAVPGSTWEMERNPNYFKAGQPYIDSVKMTFVPDTSTRIATFFTHGVDLQMGPGGPPAQFLPQFHKLVEEGKISSVKFLTGIALTGTFMALTQPPFDNLKLRQAVNLAIDRRGYSQAIYRGIYGPALLVYTEADGAYGRPGSQLWDVVPGWGTGAKKQQEIQQAKQLVKDAGYPNGLDIKFMSRANQPAHELISKWLVDVGIRAPLEVLPSSDLFNSRFLKQDYAVTQYNFLQTTAAPEEVVGGFWLTGGARNASGYANPEVDRLYVQMANELDPAKKVALFKQIEEIIVIRDVGYAGLGYTVPELFWWNRVQNVDFGMSPHPTGESGLTRGDRLWFKD